MFGGYWCMYWWGGGRKGGGRVECYEVEKVLLGVSF